MLNIKKIRQEAKNLGYTIKKGNRHYLYNNAVVRDDNGDVIPGYEVIDNSTGFCIWGCYDNNFTNLWSLEDVHRFLVSEGAENL